MKVYYCQMDGGNVGDDLNAVLWSRLFPALARVRTWDWLVGIGTILDRSVDSVPGSKVVLGAGYRPSMSAWRPAHEVHIQAVRGRLTATKLGLGEAVTQCDPGFLIPRLFPEARPSGNGIGFIPHVFSERFSFISQDAADLGLQVISPRLDVSEFVSRLHQCSRVFCESMHAAIFADAFRIPWVRVKASSHYYERCEVSDFKWQDAFSVTGIDAAPVNRHHVIPVFQHGRRKRFNGVLVPVRRASERLLARELVAKADDSSLFRLSDESRLRSRTEGLVEKINEVAQRETSLLN